MKIHSHNKGFTRTQNFPKSGLFNFFKNKNTKPSQNNFERKNLIGGFTLVETLVAIAIFATSVTGLISITARGINDNVFVKNKLIAAYLSQEGLELVRNMRDTSILPENAVSWQEFLSSDVWVGNCYSDSLPGANACYIDGAVGALVADECIDGVCQQPLGFDVSSSRYTYQTINNSIFTRTITIRPIASGNNEEVIVNSVVTWTQGENTHSVSYQYNLFNWFSS